MIKKVSFCVTLLLCANSYAMDDFDQEFLELWRARSKPATQEELQKAELQKKAQLLKDEKNKGIKLSKFSEAPNAFPIEPSKKVKHTVTYNELVNNFPHYRDAKDLNDLNLDRNALLIEAEQQVCEWSKLSNKEEEISNIVGLGLISIASGVFAFVPWLESSKKQFGDDVYACGMASAVAVGIVGRCLWNACGYYKDMKMKDALLFNKSEHEKVRDWLLSLKEKRD